MRAFRLICGAYALAAAPFALAADYDEAIDGDLSDSNTAPTAVALDVGANTVAGTTVATPLDRDLFVVSLADGQAIDSIILSSYSGPVGGNGSFFAVEAGTQITDFGNGSALLGADLIGNSPGEQAGDDVLDDLGAGGLGGAAGFTPPLAGPGTFTFWFQELSGPTAYSFTLNVSEAPAAPLAVPLPPWGLVALGLALVYLVRRVS